MSAKGSDDELYDEIYNEIKNIRVPLLTLDKGWHDLFPEGKSGNIMQLEKEVNNALKHQGRARTDKEDLNKLKQTLLKQIVNNMDAGENSRAEKKIEKSKKLIEEINDKLVLIEDKELNIPDELEDANNRLLMEGMDELLSKSIKNKTDIEELEGLIEEARIELKKKIMLREQKIEENEQIENYFNRLLGRKTVRKYEKYLSGEE